MKSFDIVTLTVSPALESAHFQDWFLNKIRCQTPLFDAGGGINVSKAISLEGKSLAVITLEDRQEKC
jgi:fructose-1-phosphate kinase PfkB-like protein